MYYLVYCLVLKMKIYFEYRSSSLPLSFHDSILYRHLILDFLSQMDSKMHLLQSLSNQFLQESIFKKINTIHYVWSQEWEYSPFFVISEPKACTDFLYIIEIQISIKKKWKPLVFLIMQISLSESSIDYYYFSYK